jgi:hypothetical protein
VIPLHPRGTDLRHPTHYKTPTVTIDAGQAEWIANLLKSLKGSAAQPAAVQRAIDYLTPKGNTA